MHFNFKFGVVALLFFSISLISYANPNGKPKTIQYVVSDYSISSDPITESDPGVFYPIVKYPYGVPIYFKIDFDSELSEYLKDIPVPIDQLKVYFMSGPKDPWFGAKPHDPVAVNRMEIPLSFFNNANLGKVTSISGVLFDTVSTQTFFARTISSRNYSYRNYRPEDVAQNIYVDIVVAGPDGKPLLLLGSKLFNCFMNVNLTKNLDASYTLSEMAGRENREKDILNLLPISSTGKKLILELRSQFLEALKSQTYSLSDKKIKSMTCSLNEVKSIPFFWSKTVTITAITEEGRKIRTTNIEGGRGASWNEFEVITNGRFENGNLSTKESYQDILKGSKKLDVKIRYKADTSISFNYSFDINFTGDQYFVLQGGLGSDGAQGENGYEEGMSGGRGGNGGRGLKSPDILITTELIKDSRGKELLLVRIKGKGVAFYDGPIRQSSSTNPSEFAIETVVDPAGGKIIINSVTGNGGNGGNGGTGGKHNTCKGIYRSGNGGPGGNGGKPGEFGQIKLQLTGNTSKYKSIFTLNARMGKPGNAGNGGRPGDAGGYNSNCGAPQSGDSGKNGSSGDDFGTMATTPPEPIIEIK